MKNILTCTKYKEVDKTNQKMLKKLISPYLKEQSICLTDFYVIAQLLANKLEMEFLEFKVDRFSEVKD